MGGRIQEGREYNRSPLISKREFSRDICISNRLAPVTGPALDILIFDNFPLKSKNRMSHDWPVPREPTIILGRICAHDGRPPRSKIGKSIDPRITRTAAISDLTNGETLNDDDFSHRLFRYPQSGPQKRDPLLGGYQ